MPSLPRTFDAQLATLVKTPPEGDEWLHEIKLDGYRIGLAKNGARVTLTSRNGKDWTAKFPEIVEAARSIDASTALIDGEVAVMLPDGRTSFQALQNSQRSQTRDRLVFFAFDLLYRDGEDVAHEPLEARKAKLADLLGVSNGDANDSGRIRYTDHVKGSGARVLASACKLGLEGIVSKRRNQPYVPGRHGGWLKTKCINRQEFVVAGFTDPEGSRQGIGALIVGDHDDRGRLRFAGKVGTGFSHRTALDLRTRLNTLEQKACPFDPPPAAAAVGKRAHWVRPALVVEIVFAERTDDGRLRHPSFQGLRADKAARDVVREDPKDVEAAAPRAAPRARAAPSRARGSRRRR